MRGRGKSRGGGETSRAHRFHAELAAKRVGEVRGRGPRHARERGDDVARVAHKVDESSLREGAHQLAEHKCVRRRLVSESRLAVPRSICCHQRGESVSAGRRRAVQSSQNFRCV